MMVDSVYIVVHILYLLVAGNNIDKVVDKVVDMAVGKVVDMVVGNTVGI